MSNDRNSISLGALVSMSNGENSESGAARKLQAKGAGESAQVTSPKMNERKAVGIDLGTTFSASRILTRTGNRKSFRMRRANGSRLP